MSTLILFARAIERGRVKTRLSARVGPEAALALYRAFLEDVCATAAGVAERSILAVAGDGSGLEPLARRHGFVVARQADGDLGARMAQAIAGELPRGGPVCVMGSDAPSVPRAEIARAFSLLGAGAEVVLGPSLDRGYWLVGASTQLPPIFEEMAWSTPEVLPETLRRLRARRTALLSFQYDVDEGADLDLLAAHLFHLDAEVAPATRRALAALGLIC